VKKGKKDSKKGSKIPDELINAEPSKNIKNNAYGIASFNLSYLLEKKVKEF